MISVMIFYQTSVITKMRETTWNSEVLPPKYTAFQLESVISHFPDGDGNKCGMGDVCQNLRPILNPKVNPFKSIIPTSLQLLTIYNLWLP